MSVESQRARLRHCVNTVHAGRKVLAIERTRQCMGGVAGIVQWCEMVVCADEIQVSLLGYTVPRVNRPRNRASGLSDRGAGPDSQVSSDSGVSTCHRRAGQSRKARRRTQ